MFCVCALNALQNSMILTPRWPSAGPTGGDGLAAPAGICPTHFGVYMPVTGPKILRLLYLHKIEFHRSCAAEDRNQHPHLPLFGTHFFHCSVEILEGPIDHLDRFTHLEEHLGLGS